MSSSHEYTTSLTSNSPRGSSDRGASSTWSTPSPSLIAEDVSTSSSDGNSSSSGDNNENPRRSKSVRIASEAVIITAADKTLSSTTAAAAGGGPVSALPPSVSESDLSSEDGDDLQDSIETSTTPTVHIATHQRRGRIQYTADTHMASSNNNGRTGSSSDESSHLNDDDDDDQSMTSNATDPLVTTPIIRRRRRIGRPFTASSPMGWNEEYLASPVSPTKKSTTEPIRSSANINKQEEVDDDIDTKDDEFPLIDQKSTSDDDDIIAMPSLGVDAQLKAPDMPLSPPQELRRRRRRRGRKIAGASSTCSRKTTMAENESESNGSETKKDDHQFMSFSAFRINYLIVHIAIMLADGLQGTHLYVLYEGYGYSVASLYCLGFLTGAVTSPFIGPFVDKIGRKKAAMLYCSLEMFINWLEQFPYFYGLIVSRVIGGITTNLLFSVFESWLVTEHRRRGYAEEKLETILRDSVILSNLAAIASGFLAEFLAVKFGPVGPFEGAVTCTAIALVLVSTMWRENYGSDVPGVQSVRGYMASAFETIVTDTNISRIGLIQGLTEGSLQTFVFLWSPALARFAANAPSNVLGLDGNGEPAYGLIFGAFMACGVAGGLSEPYVRQVATYLVRDHDRRAGLRRRDTIIIDGEGEVKPAAVEFLATGVYLACAGLLMVPYLVPADGEYSFSISLLSFLVYEFMVGLYMPCEGVIRSIYMPTSSVCSVMTMLRVIVNIAVALGVISTNYVPFTTAFAAISTLMVISAGIQLSMVDNKEWRNFVRRMSSIHTFNSFHACRSHEIDDDDIKAALKDLKQLIPGGKGIEKGACSAPAGTRMSPNTSINSDFEEQVNLCS